MTKLFFNSSNHNINLAPTKFVSTVDAAQFHCKPSKIEIQIIFFKYQPTFNSNFPHHLLHITIKTFCSTHRKNFLRQNLSLQSRSFLKMCLLKFSWYFCYGKHFPTSEAFPSPIPFPFFPACWHAIFITLIILWVRGQFCWSCRVAFDKLAVIRKRPERVAKLKNKNKTSKIILCN